MVEDGAAVGSHGVLKTELDLIQITILRYSR